MKIAVECYAGHRGEEEPRAFTLGETRFDVQAILVGDGRRFVLRHDIASDDWELAALVGR